MQSVSGLRAGAVQWPAAVSGAKAPEVERSGDKAQSRPLKPVIDEYIPEEKQEPTGRYWLRKDGDGKPQIYFDDPERSVDQSQKSDSCTCNTDTVDLEIEKLKREQEKLEQQINSETDGSRIKELGKKLAQVERELSQKDNNTYRRQHAVFS